MAQTAGRNPASANTGSSGILLNSNETTAQTSACKQRARSDVRREHIGPEDACPQLELPGLQTAAPRPAPLRRLNGLPRAARHRLRCVHDVILMHPRFLCLCVSVCPFLSLSRQFFLRHEHVSRTANVTHEHSIPFAVSKACNQSRPLRDWGRLL